MGENRFEDVRISVSKELADHYKKIITRRDKILDEDNEKEQVVVSILSATTQILRDLSKLQEEVYNAETFAVFQQAVIAVLKEEDEALVERVLIKIEELETT